MLRRFVLAGVILSSLLVATPVSAGTQDFTFSDMVVTFELEHQPNGSSLMHVDEQLVANFPDFYQNKGIVRAIPRTNQNGTNLVFPKQDVKVTRNGITEPIYETEQTSEYFYVSTGTDSYLLGDQLFGFKYYYENVITDFGDHQELYWDVNGNASSQVFNGVTAVIILDDKALAGYTGNVTCYTGSYGSAETSCETFQENDTITVSATQPLMANETLTFALEFAPNTFVIPAKPVTYHAIIIGILSLLISALLAFFGIRNYYRYTVIPKRENKQFIKPEYQPPKDVSVLMSSGIYGKDVANALSALLIDLAVRGNLRIIESERGILNTKKYTVELLGRDDLHADESQLLDILFAKSDTLELRRTAQSAMATKIHSFNSGFRERLVKAGLYNNKQHALTSGLFILSIIVSITTVGVNAIINEELIGHRSIGEPLVAIAAGLAGVLGLILLSLSFDETRYSNFSPKGWQLHYYLLGLEEYIKLAETERIKFHQSVKGAGRVEADNQAIVKLYEKLLPYAILFGLERSWSKAIQVHASEGYSPDWYSGRSVMNAMVLSSMLGSFNSSVHSSFRANSTGASSSSGSGFGGGGFAGGGGGGGGFGGR